jgi:hypothetical protein
MQLAIAAIEQQVARLEIAQDDAALVGMGDQLGDLDRELEPIGGARRRSRAIEPAPARPGERERIGMGGHQPCDPRVIETVRGLGHRGQLTGSAGPAPAQRERDALPWIALLDRLEDRPPARHQPPDQRVSRIA